MNNSEVLEFINQHPEYLADLMKKRAKEEYNTLGPTEFVARFLPFIGGNTMAEFVQNLQGTNRTTSLRTHTTGPRRMRMDHIATVTRGTPFVVEDLPNRYPETFGGSIYSTEMTRRYLENLLLRGGQMAVGQRTFRVSKNDDGSFLVREISTTNPT